MSKRILVVDDDQGILKVIKIHLEANGYETVVASDGEEAFKEVERQKPDLVVADLIMPNLNGWWLSQKLKEDLRFKEIPLILLSGLLDKDGPPEGNEVGDYYMAKPLKFDKLLAKIKELIKP